MSSRISAFSYLSFFTIFTLLLLVPSISYAGPQAPQGAVPTIPATSFKPSGKPVESPSLPGNSKPPKVIDGSVPSLIRKPVESPSLPGNSKPPKVIDGSVPSLIRLKDTALGKSVVELYLKVLEGPPSDRELQDAVDQLSRSRKSWVTMQQIEANLRASNEFYLLSLEKLYEKHLERQKNPDSWYDLVVAKRRPSLAAVEQSILSSEEYAEKWLGAQYREWLHRCPTEAEYQKLVAALFRKKVSFDAVLDGIRKSPEAADVVKLKKPAHTTPCYRFMQSIENPGPKSRFPKPVTSESEPVTSESEAVKERLRHSQIGSCQQCSKLQLIYKDFLIEYVVQKDGQPKPSSYRLIDRQQIKETNPNFPEPDKRVAYIEGNNGEQKLVEYYVAYQKQRDIPDKDMPYERREVYWTEKPISQDQYIKYYQVKRKLLALKYYNKASPEDPALSCCVEMAFAGNESRKVKLDEYDEYSYELYIEFEMMLPLEEAVEGLLQCLKDATGFTIDQWQTFHDEADTLPAAKQQKFYENIFSEIVAKELAAFDRRKQKRFFRNRKAKLTVGESLEHCVSPHLSSMFTIVSEMIALEAAFLNIPVDDLLLFGKIESGDWDDPRAPVYLDNEISTEKFARLVHEASARIGAARSAAAAERSAAALFRDSLKGLSTAQLLELFEDAPTFYITEEEVRDDDLFKLLIKLTTHTKTTIVDGREETIIATRNIEYLDRLVQEGIIYIDNRQIYDKHLKLKDTAILKQGFIVILIGEKEYFLVRLNKIPGSSPK